MGQGYSVKTEDELVEDAMERKMKNFERVPYSPKYDDDIPGFYANAEAMNPLDRPLYKEDRDSGNDMLETQKYGVDYIAKDEAREIEPVERETPVDYSIYNTDVNAFAQKKV